MENPYFGKILLLDDMIQISEKYEDNYTKYLVREIVKPEHTGSFLIIGAVIKQK